MQKKIKTRIIESLKFEISYEKKAKKDKIRPIDGKFDRVQIWTKDYHEGYIDGLKRAVELINEQHE